MIDMITPPRDSILEVRDLVTNFSTPEGVVRAVDGISINVRSGESVAIVGESGSGKSTTALSIMQLIPPPGRIVGGNIIYKGKDLAEFSEREMEGIRGKEISMVFQDPRSFLNPLMRVGDQISEAIELHFHNNRETVKKTVIETLKKVGIHDPEQVARYYPHKLSGGMAQRVLIAIAVSCRPSLLIADEATTALDTTVQSQIVDLLRTLKDESGMSLLVITHDLGIVAELCDRVYVMYGGKIMETSDVRSLFRNPQHPYTKALLKCVLSTYEYKDKLESLEGSVPDLTRPPIGCRFHPRCPLATQECREREPPPVRTGESAYAYCWKATST